MSLSLPNFLNVVTTATLEGILEKLKRVCTKGASTLPWHMVGIRQEVALAVMLSAPLSYEKAWGTGKVEETEVCS